MILQECEVVYCNYYFVIRLCNKKLCVLRNRKKQYNLINYLNNLLGFYWFDMQNFMKSVCSNFIVYYTNQTLVSREFFSSKKWFKVIYIYIYVYRSSSTRAFSFFRWRCAADALFQIWVDPVSSLLRNRIQWHTLFYFLSLQHFVITLSVCFIFSIFPQAIFRQSLSNFYQHSIECVFQIQSYAPNQHYIYFFASRDSICSSVEHCFCEGCLE